MSIVCTRLADGFWTVPGEARYGYRPVHLWVDLQVKKLTPEQESQTKSLEIGFIYTFDNWVTFKTQDCQYKNIDGVPNGFQRWGANFKDSRLFRPTNTEYIVFSRRVTHDGQVHTFRDPGNNWVIVRNQNKDRFISTSEVPVYGEPVDSKNLQIPTKLT